MKRKQTIIISIIGIVVMVTLLVGLTYGYYLARIKNNPTSDNIIGSTGKLELEYSDGNGIVTNDGILLIPGQSLPKKTFTVTNTGDLTVKNYEIVLTEVTNTLGIKEDLIYTLTCKSSKGTCNGAENIIFPSKNSVVVLNDIKPKEEQQFSLTVTYKNALYAQDANMGGIFSAKVDIKSSLYNPYKEGTLAYNIIENAINAKEETSTIYSPTPKTVPAKEASNTDERTLSITEDDYGNSYYFRGNVQDNYLNFNNMCWRIVRIEGDGSVKLILEDQTQTCESATGGDNAFIGSSSYGYIGDGTKENPYKIDYLNCTSNNYSDCLRAKLQKWFDDHFATYQESNYPNNNKSILKNEFQDKIKYATWDLGNLEDYYNNNGEKVDENYCLETESCYYEAFFRNGKITAKDRYATLKSTEKNTKFKDYVSTITIDEIHFAGLTWVTSIENAKSNYIHNSSRWWWTLSPASYGVSSNKTSYYSGVSDVSPAKETYGGTNTLANNPTQNSHIRPMIVLNNMTINNVLGTKSNPYKVE